jgi:hypothetical protein
MPLSTLVLAARRHQQGWAKGAPRGVAHHLDGEGARLRRRLIVEQGVQLGVFRLQASRRVAPQQKLLVVLAQAGVLGPQIGQVADVVGDLRQRSGGLRQGPDHRRHQIDDDAAGAFHQDGVGLAQKHQGEGRHHQRDEGEALQQKPRGVPPSGNGAGFHPPTSSSRRNAPPRPVPPQYMRDRTLRKVRGLSSARPVPSATQVNGSSAIDTGSPVA